MCDNSYACFINDVFCVFSSFIILTVIKIYVDAGVQVLCLHLSGCVCVCVCIRAYSCHYNFLSAERGSRLTRLWETRVWWNCRGYIVHLCSRMFVCVCMQKVFVWLWQREKEEYLSLRECKFWVSASRWVKAAVSRNVLDPECESISSPCGSHHPEPEPAALSQRWRLMAVKLLWSTLVSFMRASSAIEMDGISLLQRTAVLQRSSQWGQKELSTKLKDSQRGMTWHFLLKPLGNLMRWPRSQQY